MTKQESSLLERKVPRARRARGLTVGCLLLGTLLGCGKELLVGEQPCQRGTEGCENFPLDLAGPTVGTAARATNILMPTWVKPMSAGPAVRAADGGLWLATIRGQDVVLQHATAEGEVDGETVVAPPPAPDYPALYMPALNALREHPKGPVLSVVWSLERVDGRECNGRVWPPGFEQPSTSCSLSFEGLLFDVGGSAPLRIDVTVVSDGLEKLGDVYRSGDGESVVLQTDDKLELRSLIGTSKQTFTLPSGYRERGGGTFYDADRWAFYVSSADTMSEDPSAIGKRALVTLQRGGEPELVELLGVDISHTSSGDGLLFPGPVPGQLIAVVERYAPGSSNSISNVPGDIGILRFTGGQLESQQVLLRDDFVGLSVMGASVDPDGNVYVVTQAGSRAQFLSGSLTPLLCRIPTTGEGACGVLPERFSQFHAMRGGVVLVPGRDQLTRFDFPIR